MFEHLVPIWVLFGEVLEPSGGGGFLEEGLYLFAHFRFALLPDVMTQLPVPAAMPPRHDGFLPLWSHTLLLATVF